MKGKKAPLSQVVALIIGMQGVFSTEGAFAGQSISPYYVPSIPHYGGSGNKDIGLRAHSSDAGSLNIIQQLKEENAKLKAEIELKDKELASSRNRNDELYSRIDKLSSQLNIMIARMSIGTGDTQVASAGVFRFPQQTGGFLKTNASGQLNRESEVRQPNPLVESSNGATDIQSKPLGDNTSIENRSTETNRGSNLDSVVDSKVEEVEEAVSILRGNQVDDTNKRHFLFPEKKRNEALTISKKNPVDIIARFNTKRMRDHYYQMLKKEGFKDAFVSRSIRKNDWLIYLGRYSEFGGAYEVYEKAGKLSKHGIVEMRLRDRRLAI